MMNIIFVNQLTHHVHILNINGDSSSLKKQIKKKEFIAKEFSESEVEVNKQRLKNF